MGAIGPRNRAGRTVLEALAAAAPAPRFGFTEFDWGGDYYRQHGVNNDPEMKELAARSGFELVNVGVDGMDAFMKDRIKLDTDAARKLGLGGTK